MQRLLMYRAWDNKGKKWLMGYETLGGFSMFGECMMLGEYEKLLHDDMADRIDLVLSEYTGLKDSKGVEIYEGDVVEMDRDVTDQLKVSPNRAVAEFIKGQFLPRPHGEVFEVIGNVYEHPELLTP